MALVAARRERVLTMRAAGMSYQQIADQEPSLKTASNACQDAHRALANRRAERVIEGEPVSLELERLAGLERAAQTVMRTAATTGQSPGTVLKAIDRLVSISRRRDSLLGISARAQMTPRQPAGDQGFDEVGAQRRKRRAAQGW
jgi:hypothetical protein